MQARISGLTSKRIVATNQIHWMLGRSGPSTASRERRVGGASTRPMDRPIFPFQRWAMKVEPVFPSPIGILIHPDYGLWHAYRAAICLHQAIPVPSRDDRPSPCDSCADKPCLSTCPVGAFSRDGYDVPALRGASQNTGRRGLFFRMDAGPGAPVPSRARISTPRVRLRFT